ncbi:MAG: hypothetical protein WKF75_11420 [Singulisphaera sp.]
MEGCRSRSTESTRVYRDPDAAEAGDFLRLFDEAFDRVRPTAVVAYGGDRLTYDILARSRRRSAATVFTLTISNTAALPLSPTWTLSSFPQFAADHYLNTLRLRCTVLPNLVDLSVYASNDQISLCDLRQSVTGEGVFPFVRIADEIGRRRPDIPILVVESRGPREFSSPVGSICGAMATSTS